MKHLNIKVHGCVQGVFFRANARDKADELKLNGFARNEDDGSVYIEVEGDEKNLDEFVKWCHEGPKGAHIDKMQVKVGELIEFKEFEIKY